MSEIAAALCAAVFVLVLLVGEARAHAQLIETDPADDAVLDEAPATVTLTFNEAIRPLVAHLVHPDGRTKVLDDIEGRGSAVVLVLPAELGDGTHILSWRVVSSDGHPVGGSLLFSVGAPSDVSAPAVEQSDLSVRIGLWTVRFALLVGVLIGVGGVVFQVLVVRAKAPCRADRPVTGALLLGLVSTPLLVGFQGLDVLGVPLVGLATASVWEAGLWATSYGRAVLLAAAAMLVAYAVLQVKSRSHSSAILALIALTLVGTSFASAGHASTAPPALLTVPAVVLHVLTALLWIGALIPLGVSLARGGADASSILLRFSWIIPPIVVILALSGLLLAVVQIQTFAALWTTDYGRVMLIKSALVAAMLVLATVNRYRLTAPAASGDAGATRRLARNVAAEIVLVSAVIAALGLWRFTPPPRAMAEDAASFETQRVVAESEGLKALVSIAPPIVGPVRIEVGDLALDGEALEPIAVSVELDKPAYGIGPFMREARPTSGHTFVAEGFVLPLDGFWIVRVTVLVSEFRSVTLTDIFDVRDAPR